MFSDITGRFVAKIGRKSDEFARVSAWNMSSPLILKTLQRHDGASSPCKPQLREFATNSVTGLHLVDNPSYLVHGYGCEYEVYGLKPCQSATSNYGFQLDMLGVIHSIACLALEGRFWVYARKPRACRFLL